MDSSMSNAELTIFLEGRIDASNAAQIDEEIADKWEGSNCEKLILDVQGVEYISSMGLRVVLSLAKKKIPMKVINASNEVYDVFDITGFTSIIDVTRAMRSISVEGCEVIGKGGHGTVYRLDDETIVKAYTEETTLEEILQEMERAKKAFIHGVPTAISYDTVKCGSSYGTVYEMINSATLAQYLANHPAQLKPYAGKYAELFRTMHTTTAPEGEFADIRGIYNALAEAMREYLTAEEVEALHKVINAIPDGKTLVHNDFHPGNIMVQDDELLLIDMSDVSFGHPIFDFAGASLSVIVMGALDPERTKRMFGLDYSRCVELWNEMISCYFNTTDAAMIDRINTICQRLGYVKFSLAPAVSVNLTDESIKTLVGISRKLFFPTVPQIIDDMAEFAAMFKAAGI